NAAKDAAIHIARLISYEFMKAGVRFNSITPGCFPSFIICLLNLSSGGANTNSHTSEEIVANGHVPIKGACSSVGMARGILFLEMKIYVNGAIVSID
ncbi:hypothetical protein OIDMADRAFT_113316, partial [Oidiodendron maius Zn]